ncbi:MAG: DMT family transporter [Acidobacteria bacterium]|nr:DMT family transporter [Acidobacteriota bacterium]
MSIDPPKILSSGVTQMFLATFSFFMANVFVKELSEMPVMEIVLFRSFIAGVFCYYGIRKAGVSWKGNNKSFLIYRGIAGTTALVLFFLTLHNIPLASATTIQYLSPIFTAFIAIFFLKEEVKILQWLFYAMAFGGVLLIKNFDPRVSLFYLLMGIISAFGSGVAYNLVRRLKDTEHPLVIILYFQIVGVVASIPVMWYVWKTPAGIEWVYLLFVGIFSLLGQVFLTNAFSREKAASVAIIVYTGLVYAISVGWIVYGERQGLFAFLGMLLVVAGVMASVLYGRRQRDLEKLEAVVE